MKSSRTPLFQAAFFVSIFWPILSCSEVSEKVQPPPPPLSALPPQLILDKVEAISGQPFMIPDILRTPSDEVRKFLMKELSLESLYGITEADAKSLAKRGKSDPHPLGLVKSDFDITFRKSTYMTLKIMMERNEPTGPVTWETYRNFDLSKPGFLTAEDFIDPEKAQDLTRKLAAERSRRGMPLKKKPPTASRFASLEDFHLVSTGIVWEGNVTYTWNELRTYFGSTKAGNLFTRLSE